MSVQASPLGSSASPWSLKRVGWKRRRASEPSTGSPRSSSWTATLSASPASNRVQQTGQTCAPLFCSAARAGAAGLIGVGGGQSSGAACERLNPTSMPTGVHASVSGALPSWAARSSSSVEGHSAINSPAPASKSAQREQSAAAIVASSSGARISSASSVWSVDASRRVTGARKGFPLRREWRSPGSTCSPSAPWTARTEQPGCATDSSLDTPRVPVRQLSQRTWDDFLKEGSIGAWRLEAGEVQKSS